MPFRIIAADHTGITVSNLERSLAFWRDVLGFELSHRAHQTGELAEEITGVPGAEISLAVLKAPGHKIELLEYLAPRDRKRIDLRPCDVGSVHVAVLVTLPFASCVAPSSTSGVNRLAAAVAYALAIAGGIPVSVAAPSLQLR